MIRQPDAQGNRVLDYSGVGYLGGTVAIPNVTAKTNLSPVARADNGPRIQAAINYVSALPLVNGFRGAVFLNAGEYAISNSITISASGVVLRGAGDGTNGTILRAAGTRPTASVSADHAPLVIISGSGSAVTSGTARNITNNYVPVGARSFNVDSTSGLTVGSRVMITRPSPSNWIHDIGMNLVSPAWTAGGFNVAAERFIMRIEGNRVMLDAPLTCALETQYGGGTIQTCAWSGRINNVGIEDLRGISDFDPTVMTNTGASTYYYSDELHALDFIAADTVENAWVRRVTSLSFGYGCVHLSAGSRSVTVRDCNSLDPVSIITGERRYAFNLQDARHCLVQNCYTRNDRHQFVTDSLNTGPNVFLDGLSDNAYADAGPHFRWGTGAIWDNITVNGDNVDLRNRGNAGTSHGWAGANEVVWNAQADGFIVESPATARNWLIGSLGPLAVNTLAVGPHPAGTYDSLGTNVYPNSLYYAQLQDRLTVPDTETREYWLGPIDQFASSSPAGEVVTVDSTWRSTVQAAAGGGQLNNFDVVTNNQWVPFTFNFSLAVTDRIVGATLALAMRSKNGASTNEAIYLGFITNSNSFASLGWLPVGTGTNTTVRVLDLASQLNLLTNGQLNVAVADDVGIDWAMLELQVEPVRTLYTNAILPMADAYVRGGTNAGLNFGTSTTLDIKADSVTNNQRQAHLRWNLAGYSTRLQQARIRLTPVSVGTNGYEHGLTSGTGSTWSESTLNWTNQPVGGKRFASWLPAANVPVEILVTPQAQAALAADGQLSLEVFSLRNLGGSGLVSYASREDANPALRPQLLLLYSNAVPVFAGLTSPTITYGTTNLILVGTLSGFNGVTLVYPSTGETISATVNGRTITGTVTNSTGRFAVNYNDASLKTNDVSGSPYLITYAYAGNNTSLTAAGNDSSTALTVNPAPVTITSGITANNKTYDGTNTATISSNNAVLSGVIPADTNYVALSLNSYTATFDNADAGTNKPVTVSGLSLTGTRANNYLLIQPTNLTASITTVGNLPVLSIFASATNKAYGQSVTFAGTEFTTLGLNNPDTVTSVTLSSSGATNTADAGSYSITPTNAVGSGLTNYHLSYVNGTLTVVKAQTVFGNLLPSQAIPTGTPSVALTGNVAAPGPVYPANGTPLNVTINGTTQMTTTINSNGSFFIVFSTAGIPVAGSAYPISYAYAGDANFAGVTHSGTALAPQQA